MICIDKPMPESCAKCMFAHPGGRPDRDCGGTGAFCGYTGKHFTDENWWHDVPQYPETRPDWCPLKDVDESFAIWVLISSGYKVIQEKNATRLVKYKYDQD